MTVKSRSCACESRDHTNRAVRTRTVDAKRPDQSVGSRKVAHADSAAAHLAADELHRVSAHTNLLNPLKIHSVTGTAPGVGTRRDV